MFGLTSSRAGLAASVLGAAAAGLALAAALAACQTGADPHRWSAEDAQTLRGLWIGALPALPPDPTNAYADNEQAARLGQQLFFDVRFSSNAAVACSTCHLPELQFQDGTPLAHGVGTTTRRTMSIIGAAYSPWLFWDGRNDSLWAQALGPLENPVEHGGNRTQYAHLIAQHYHAEYEALFGPLPDLSGFPPNAGPVEDPQARAAWQMMAPEDQSGVTHIYVNLGKAIAAYERRILPGQARFDAYVQALLAADRTAMEAALTANEAAGLRLFIGRASCIDCHNGPLFTNNDFHNTGVPAVAGLPEDTGRLLGAQQVLADEFNCLSAYNDAGPAGCAELRFLVVDDHDLVRKFRPPSLRGVAERAPYMHAGQFATLDEVLAHYNRAPAAPAGHSELVPLRLTEHEIDQLVAFLHALSGPVAADPAWLAPPGAAAGH
jgi:cytochrome c peroxidase